MENKAYVDIVCIAFPIVVGIVSFFIKGKQQKSLNCFVAYRTKVLIINIS